MNAPDALKYARVCDAAPGYFLVRAVEDSDGHFVGISFEVPVLAFGIERDSFRPIPITPAGPMAGERAMLRPDGGINILGTSDYFPTAADWLAQLESDAGAAWVGRERKQDRYEQFMAGHGIDVHGAVCGLADGAV